MRYLDATDYVTPQMLVARTACDDFLNSCGAAGGGEGAGPVEALKGEIEAASKEDGAELWTWSGRIQPAAEASGLAVVHRGTLRRAWRVESMRPVGGK